MVYWAVNAFPDLENYIEFWPVNDIVMMRLKYTSGCARQKEAEMVTGRSKKRASKVSTFYSESQINTKTLLSTENLIIHSYVYYTRNLT
jgi:hypothetical protein